MDFETHISAGAGVTDSFVCISLEFMRVLLSRFFVFIKRVKYESAVKTFTYVELLQIFITFKQKNHVIHKCLLLKNSSGIQT
jgi:hypothetical protein